MKLRLFTALLTRPSSAATLSRNRRCGGFGSSASEPALHVLEHRANNNTTSHQHTASIFGLVLRYATPEESSAAPGNLIVDAILPDSAAARCGMLQVREPILDVSTDPMKPSVIV